MEDDTDLTEEEVFHNNVREYVIFMLLFVGLYACSAAIISIFRRGEREEYSPEDEEEAVVYRISLRLCTFSVAVSVGAALLLPISIISNEILLHYPSSYYVKWLNSSLIQGLWNIIFLFSNLSLLVLLPFAYFFTESEGFTGSRKGILARVYETFVVLLLLAVIVFGMALIISAVLDKHHSMLDRVFSVGSNYLPFLYSCMSFFGVLFLLVCTPVGFARLFTLVGKVVLKPQFLRDVHEEYYTAKFQRDSLQRLINKEAEARLRLYNGRLLQNGELRSNLEELEISVTRLNERRKASALRRNLGYPVAMLLLVILTTVAVLRVIHNTLQLLIGIKALPASSKQFTLGISSLSSLGWIGAVIEIILIGYLMVTSVVGLYSLPWLRDNKPRLQSTPVTRLITNSAMLLILSSALPLLARILGITNFDLLGNFGYIKWLGEFWLVLLYNIGFAAAAAVCVGNQFSAPVRQAVWRRIKHAVFGVRPDNVANSPNRHD